MKTFMVLNPEKSHFMVLSDPNYIFNLICNGETINKMQHRITKFRFNDWFNLTFTLHLGNLIMKANHKFHAMSKKNFARPMNEIN